MLAICSVPLCPSGTRRFVSTLCPTGLPSSCDSGSDPRAIIDAREEEDPRGGWNAETARASTRPPDRGLSATRRDSLPWSTTRWILCAIYTNSWDVPVALCQFRAGKRASRRPWQGGAAVSTILSFEMPLVKEEVVSFTKESS